MTTQDEDREGAKPYKTYKARSAAAQPGRRRTGRRETGARAPAGERARRLGSATRLPPPVRQSVPHLRPGAGRRKAGKKANKGAGQAPRRKRRFRWWYVPVGAFAVLVIAGVVATVIAWPGYQKFDRAVDKANKRVDKKTKAQLSADEGWIWRKGTTVLLFGLDDAGLPAHSDTIMLMRFNPGSHQVNTLSIPRDTLVNIDGYGQQKITAGHVVRRAVTGGQDRQAVHGHSRQPCDGRRVPGVPAHHQLRRRHRHVRAPDGETGAGPGWSASSQRVVTFEKGMHHFDGKDAMLYVRIRKAYAEGDYTRAARQQAFVQAVQKKLVQPSNITKLPEIGKHFMSGVTTDLTTNQILELAYLKWRATGGKKQVMKGDFGWNQRSGRRAAAQRCREGEGDRRSSWGTEPPAPREPRPAALVIGDGDQRQPSGRRGLAHAAALAGGQRRLELLQRHPALGHVDHRADGHADHVVEEAAGRDLEATSAGPPRPASGRRRSRRPRSPRARSGGRGARRA